MSVPMDPVVDNVPNILVDRVLTADVFCLIIHYGLFYAIQVLFDFYLIVFHFDLPQVGLWSLVKHPFQFIFSTVFSLGWLYLCVVVGLLTWINYRRLQWIKSYKTMRDVRARLDNISYGAAHVLLGILLAGTYLRFINRKNYIYAAASSEVPVEYSGVDERYSLVLLSCGVVSLYFYASFLSTVDYVMKFPLIETSALLRLRSVVVPTLKDAFKLSFHVTFLSYLINIFFGDWFHTLVCIFTTAGLGENEKPKLAGITNYFDLELLFVVMLCQVLVTFTMKSLWLTTEAIVTKRIKFRIGDEVVGASSLGLRDMMVSSNIYLKKLAYFDLKLLTEYDEQRMLALFTLSHPGGFPKIWSTISKACLDQIHRLTKDLRNYVENANSEKKKSEARSVDSITQSLCGPRADFVASSSEMAGVKLRSRFGVSAMRNLHLQNGDENRHVEKEPIGIYYEILENPFAPVAKLLKFTFELVSKYFLKLLSIMNLLKYFKDGTETDVASIFADQETTLWAVCALTDVVVASTKIDTKGIVQADICHILTSLVELCSALDDFRALKDGNRAELYAASGDVKILVPNSGVKTLVQEFRKPLKNEIMRIHLKFHQFYDIINIQSSCEQVLRRLTYHD